jgi:4-hydroxy-3-polyprenylbenzoate decarboxylase
MQYLHASQKRMQAVMNIENSSPKMRRLVVGMSGASGAVYGVRLLELLKHAGIETHLVMSRAAKLTLAYETDLKVADIEKLASVVHAYENVGAACSSGSFQNMGMIIAPCSIKTMSEIATGVTGNLLSRSADVALKERRRLVLLLRETPLHLGHIRTMAAATEAGAIIYPPVPAFYSRPATLSEMIDHTIFRALELFGLEFDQLRRWTGKRKSSELAQAKARVE